MPKMKRQQARADMQVEYTHKMELLKPAMSSSRKSCKVQRHSAYRLGSKGNEWHTRKFSFESRFRK